MRTTSSHFTVFDTALGHAGIAWSERGIVAVHLPEPVAERTRTQVVRRIPGASETAPPVHVGDAIGAIRALLRGEDADFSDAPLDLETSSEFARAVYAITRAIPRGATLTYGDVALRAGTPRDARAVGQALGSNPIPIIVPCHRVLAADGRMHGFSGPGGVSTNYGCSRSRATSPSRDRRSSTEPARPCSARQPRIVKIVIRRTGQG